MNKKWIMKIDMNDWNFRWNGIIWMMNNLEDV
jgi:hypothetical protein